MVLFLPESSMEGKKSVLSMCLLVSAMSTEPSD